MSEAALIATKLSALHMLGERLGMWGGEEWLDETKRARAKGLQCGELERCVDLIFEADALPWQQSAAMMLLDFYHPTWRDAFTPELLGYTLDRNAPEVRRWRSNVLTRDGYTCQVCGTSDGLEAHHIVPWAVAPYLRVVLANGRTLCHQHHMAEHARSC